MAANCLCEQLTPSVALFRPRGVKYTFCNYTSRVVYVCVYIYLRTFKEGVGYVAIRSRGAKCIYMRSVLSATWICGTHIYTRQPPVVRISCALFHFSVHFIYCARSVCIYIYISGMHGSLRGYVRVYIRGVLNISRRRLCGRVLERIT